MKSRSDNSTRTFIVPHGGSVWYLDRRTRRWSESMRPALDPGFVVIAAGAKMIAEPPGDDIPTFVALHSTIYTYNASDNDTIISPTVQRSSALVVRTHSLSAWRRSFANRSRARRRLGDSTHGWYIAPTPCAPIYILIESQRNITSPASTQQPSSTCTTTTAPASGPVPTSAAPTASRTLPRKTSAKPKSKWSCKQS